RISFETRDSSGTVSEAVRINENGNVGIGTTTPTAKLMVRGAGTTTGKAFSVIDSSNVEKLTVLDSGNVGIGTTTPTTNLTISTAGSTANVAVTNGWLCVDNDGGCVGGTAGTIYYRASSVGGSDVAENYASEIPLEAGEIVSAKGGPAGGWQIERATSTSRTIMGIISTQPGNLLGYEAENASSSYPVALVGRVPTKVSLENGPIAVGDKISASSVAGVGKKAVAGEATVGMALEAFVGTGVGSTPGNLGIGTSKIMVFVNLGQPSLTAAKGTGDLADMVTASADMNMNGFALLNVKSIVGMNGLWRIDESGNITAQSVQTQALTIGGGSASGVTVYDRSTTQPKCIYIEGGAIMTSDGACGTTTNAGAPAEIILASDPVPTPVVATSTPAVIATSTVAESPVVSTESNLGTGTATTTP
ncbi:MAG: hypothetical protein Q8P06_00430, partial [Candidatus Azambacteria bacterium]|nr:hypothetical protein [Candidatus Azambacteria bacterium]